MQDSLRVFATGRGLVVAPWLVLAVTDLFAEALRFQDSAYRTSVSIGLWGLWATVLVVLVLPGAAALTVARTAVPAAIPASLWALSVIEDPIRTGPLLAFALSLSATLAIALPRVGERFVDADSYGDERRFLLRAPAPVLVGVLGPTWVAAVVGLTAGPLLLADQRWITGAVVTVVGLPSAVFAVRALHRLARRWLVFVPAGLVVHDHMAIREPVMFTRGSIRRFGPAAADTNATDLTAHASGLALELELHQVARFELRTGRDSSEEQAATRLLVVPTRPAVVLSEASRRGITLT